MWRYLFRLSVTLKVYSVASTLTSLTLSLKNIIIDKCYVIIVKCNVISQIIRDTPRRRVSWQSHQMTHRNGGRGSTKNSRDTFFALFWTKIFRFALRAYIFWKMKTVTSQEVRDSVTKYHIGVGNRQKSVTYFLNGPLTS